ncbi:MAG: hypothetical protein JW931_00060 [Methanomicrobiaceae archaeon]|nr:hypothetical protein [Methanomicrobiaceae archaeon]
MQINSEIKCAVIYMVVMVATFFFFQAIVILIHEFTHSITAYLLGVMPGPFSIVWGNFFTMTCWDEGVQYSRLWATGYGVDGAITGIMPLVVHAIIISCGLYLLISGVLLKHKWGYHLVFWFIVVNLMELFAYMPMRAFASHGDTGNFNHGFGLDPWLLFFPGTILVLIFIYFLLVRAMPGMYVLIAEGSRIIKYMILCFTAFTVFIWGSGLRVVLYIYPDPQWMMGLIGFAAFGLALWFCRPDMPRVIEAEKSVSAKMKTGDPGP